MLELYPKQFPKEPDYNFDAQDEIKAVICGLYNIPNGDQWPNPHSIQTKNKHLTN